MEELQTKNGEGKMVPIGPNMEPPLEELMLRVSQLERLAGHHEKANDVVHKHGPMQIHGEVKMCTAAAKTDLDQQIAVHKADLDNINRPNMEQFLKQVRGADLKLQTTDSVHSELKEQVQSDLKLQTAAIKADLDSVYGELKEQMAANNRDLHNINSIMTVQLSGKTPIEYLELIREEMMMQKAATKTDLDQVTYYLKEQKAEPTADLDQINCPTKEFDVKLGTKLAGLKSSVLDATHPLVTSCPQGKGAEA
ncbi:unnamed protein product [Prorocentrum cordatum]|uniref:Uncharacterized protein n=1 Tax=Prorocentrum cordatum TaxID=2364126 RepID=A0ABN9TVA1_9DINO|nr:unnamed protein product [Polarella glacialis]